MNHTFYEFAALFFTYSFFAWTAETLAATIREKGFRNRGFASGPFCFIYGVTAVILTVFLQDLRQQPFFLFLGCSVIATVVEWVTGKLLEKMKRKKWWDYSGKKWNFGGYICLQYSVIWGLLGCLAVQYFNEWVLDVYHILPGISGQAIIWALTGMGLADLTGSLMTIYHLEEKLPFLFKWNLRLQRWTAGITGKLTERIEERMQKVYPAIAADAASDPNGKEGAEEGDNAEKCGIVQLFWLFFIGAFLGDIVETVFCRITAGVWMSRSSLVWGPFSIVWGLAVALFTALLFKDRDRPDYHIFWAGTFLGGAYEYLCSVFTELVFGKVFWDYSSMPFNLGGRINLLYCFFWGIAAVVWLKVLYPKLAVVIDFFLNKTGQILTLFLAVFMAMDICMSMMALIRYDTRANGAAPSYKWEQVMDERFGDERMERIYPNAMKSS